MEKNAEKMIRISLKTTTDKEFREIERPGPFVLEDLVKEIQKDMPYRILLANVNGTDRELTEVIREDARIQFFDMRTHSADLVYQKSLSLLYLKAVKDVLGVDAEIDNSLNKGLYTDIRNRGRVRTAQVEAIEKRMRELVRMDLPIVKENVSLEEGIRIWEEMGYPEKAALLKEFDMPPFDVRFYRLDDYRNYFFGLMLPSTGYLEHFELRRYKYGVLLRFPYYTKPDEVPPYVDDRKLYSAFGEEIRWMKLLKTRYLANLNQTIDEGGTRDLILLSEALHEKKISDIADEINRLNKRVILIAGPSSSGKTTFARRLCIQLRVNGLDPLYMGTDDYFVDRDQTPLDENGEPDYENLNALDIDLFNHDMNGLLAGETVDLPEFDFMEGRKVFGKRPTSIRENQLIVIEGIHALNRKLTEQIADGETFRIYISPLTQLNIDRHNRVPSTDARMLRRMARDYKYRGHSAASTIANWPKVRAGENKNIFPYNGEADVLFNSALEYEIPLLKKDVEPLLKEIGVDEPEHGEAIRILKFLEFFRTIEDESVVPNNSIIREFIGGSVFTEEKK
ncbi:MAG: nucleoside kinase [Firmicutes bacterium]|nr:nucleoside kinase [Bacillota bacterium]